MRIPAALALLSASTVALTSACRSAEESHCKGGFCVDFCDGNVLNWSGGDGNYRQKVCQRCVEGDGFAECVIDPLVDCSPSPCTPDRSIAADCERSGYVTAWVFSGSRRR